MAHTPHPVLTAATGAAQEQGAGNLLRIVLVVLLIGAALMAWFLLRGYRGAGLEDGGQEDGGRDPGRPSQDGCRGGPGGVDGRPGRTDGEAPPKEGDSEAPAKESDAEAEASAREADGGAPPKGADGEVPAGDTGSGRTGPGGTARARRRGVAGDQPGGDGDHPGADGSGEDHPSGVTAK